MELNSQIVIGSGGSVLAATGQLPPGLVDARLENCQALPLEIREAGKLRRQAIDLRELLKSKLSVIASQAASAEVKLHVNTADDVPSVVYLISDIMAAHGGRVDLSSSTDPFEQGTTVRLVFPVD
jgi:hypothetical protein